MKPIVLKELRNEITPVIRIIFEKSLETGQLRQDWTTARVSPLFKKVIKVILQSTDQYH